MNTFNGIVSCVMARKLGGILVSPFLWISTVLACGASALGFKGGIEKAPADIRPYFRIFPSEATKKSHWLVETILVN